MVSVSKKTTTPSGNTGCNEGGTTAITGTPATQTKSMVTHVSSGALIINHAAMVSSGGMVSTLCITTGNNELASANLLHIFPNPVSQSTVISFSINQSENISVNIYDITGRFIKNLYDGSLNPGNHQIEWTVTSESEIDDGVYFLNIKGGGFSQSCKLLVLK